MKTASKELQSKYGVTPGLAILEAWRFRDPRESNGGAILLLWQFQGVTGMYTILISGFSNIDVS